MKLVEKRLYPQIEASIEKMLSGKPPFILLHQVKEMIDKEVDSRLQRECQITLTQFRALAFLYHRMLRGERVQLSELADILMVTKGNVTGLIDRLRAQNYVRRVRDKGDRRRIFVEITPEGLEKLKSAIPHFQNFMQKLMTTIFTREEMMQFHKLLQKFNEKLPSALTEVKKLKTEQH
ncbi:MAG: MarR family winged helix-turn-helix transcriptional regulator [Candidatus Freyarchaeota archaeon]